MRKLALAIFVLVTALVGYEAFAVVRAQRRTPAVLERTAHGQLRLADLTSARRAALLKVEDPGFATHHGIDFSTPGQGNTNLTQSLVKQLYFEDFRPGFAKLEQMLIARFVLDKVMSKDRQLETFLNIARLGTVRGRQVIGFAEASRVYYGRSFTALDDRQFLGLVAMLMAPNKLDPIRHPQENEERVARIEALLAGRCKPEGVGDNVYPSCQKRPLPL